MHLLIISKHNFFLEVSALKLIKKILENQNEIAVLINEIRLQLIDLLVWLSIDLQ